MCLPPKLHYSDLQEMMNAVIFLHWPVLIDGFTSIPLRSSGVTAYHHSVAMGTGKKFSSAPYSDALRRLRQTRLSCTSGAKAGVRSCCLFNFPTSHKSGPSAPLFFTLSLSVSLSRIKTHFRTYPCRHLLTHIFFVCITPLSSSLTQYIPVILNSKAQVQPCLCV